VAAPASLQNTAGICDHSQRLQRGLIGLKSLETNQALQDLAAEADAFDKETRALLCTADDATIRRTLLDVPGGADFLAHVDAFLDQYGFLNTNCNDILVVPFTDVSWTPLFAGIGGLVAEMGGQLSHSAIVAREYGLPAVVNVKNATRLIKDGQEIVVDGTQGHVHLS
jgi:phosphohistidine swiveling domain-containing protein